MNLSPGVYAAGIVSTRLIKITVTTFGAALGYYLLDVRIRALASDA
jgi:hypothetical protein